MHVKTNEQSKESFDVVQFTKGLGLTVKPQAIPCGFQLVDQYGSVIYAFKTWESMSDTMEALSEHRESVAN